MFMMIFLIKSERIASKTGGGGIIDIVKVLRELLTNASLWKRIFEPLWTKRFKILPPDAKKEATCAILYDLREVRELEKDTYYYHPDHIGSANWITNSAGEPIQHLQYLPFGELRLDQRLISWHSRYTFSAKEKDEESGYSYFGARYYDSELSIWLSVDPMADKYPSLTPYNYCANNPMILVDPNGEEVFITGEAAQAAFSKLKEGTNIKLEMASNGRISIANEGNDPSTWNENDGKLFAAVMSNDVTVNLTASNSNVIERDAAGNPTHVTDAGGAFMGNSLSFDGNRKATSASTQQFVNMSKLNESYKSGDVGGVINHEITESYMGGLISMDKGKAASPAIVGSKNKIYNQAHKKAATCPTMKPYYIVSPERQAQFDKIKTSLRSLGF